MEYYQEATSSPTSLLNIQIFFLNPGRKILLLSNKKSAVTLTHRALKQDVQPHIPIKMPKFKNNQRGQVSWPLEVEMEGRRGTFLPSWLIPSSLTQLTWPGSKLQGRVEFLSGRYNCKMVLRSLNLAVIIKLTLLRGTSVLAAVLTGYFLDPSEYYPFVGFSSFLVLR